jgi:hypothetical protein
LEYLAIVALRTTAGVRAVLPMDSVQLGSKWDDRKWAITNGWAFLYSFLLKPPVDGGKPMDGNYIGNLIHRLTTQVAATRASALASAWSLDHLDSGYVDALG